MEAQTLQHRYSFTSDASDSVGGANGTLVGNANITGQMLNLPGGGNSDNPQGYVSLPNGLVTNDTSITVECWLTDFASSVWAETWCFGDSAAGPGQPPSYGTAYISLIPHSGENDFRAAFNLTGGDEIDVVDPVGPLPLNVEEYAVVTYDAPSSTALLYLNGVLVAAAGIPNNLSPANYGATFNNWFGRDEFGSDPMFAGNIDELRIWNAAISPLQIAVSAAVGPDVLVTNLTPLSVKIVLSSTNMAGGQLQQTVAAANFLQASNVPLTSVATNWISSNPSVLTVSGSGAITAVNTGSATVSAMLGGIVGTSAPITVTPFNAGSVTVAYWQFNDPSNLGSDSSGLGNTLATASGEPAYSSAGKFGGALYLDGNSAMTTLSGTFPLGVPIGTSPYTIAVWEKTDVGYPVNAGFVGWGNSSSGNCNCLRLSDLGDNPDSIDNYWWANDFYIDGLAPDPADGNWHAVAATWDGTNQIIYVDGVNMGSRIPTPPNVQGVNFLVGRTVGDANNFKGWMEDLLIANAALTPADIAVFQTGAWSPNLSTYPLLPTASPTNTVYAGTTVTLSVTVAGTPPYQYQWQKNGANISWGTNATLVLTNTATADSGNYDVIVGNSLGTNTSPALTVTVNLSAAPFFTQQPTPATITNYQGGFVSFGAVVAGTQPIQLQWQRNGVNIPNATASTLTLASLQMSEAGAYILMASNSLGVTNSFPVNLTVLSPPNPSALNVLTYHNDNTRQGANTNEVLLTLANVNTSTFGRLIAYPTDGVILAQPLYVANLAIPGLGTHNVVFVATENDSVYAFDADSNAGSNGGLLWHTNLGIAVSSYNDEFGNRYQGTYYGDIVPVVGITGTPVIDLNSGTLYVNVHSREVGTTTNYFHRLHALNIATGAEQPYSPVVITNSFPGVGVASTNGVIQFDPRTENQRPGLTMANGMVYVAYGSYADTDPYHGWVLGFNATNLAQSGNYAFNTTPNATIANFGPNAGEGALWMGGDGLCVDASNNLYFATANGSFTANNNGGDYSDSFVKLSTTNGLNVADYFTPYNQAALAANDTDLGSGGTILLPDSAGSSAHPHLMVGCGKDGILRLVDRDNMGKYNSANDNQIVQEVPGAISGAWSTPAYFNHQIYYQGSGDVMKEFLITNAHIVPVPTSRSSVNFSGFATGGTPVISANGTNNAIAWAVQCDAAGSGGPAVLHAFNATNLAIELYNSSQNLARDNPGPAFIMTTPTVVNGKVFVGAQYVLSIFGNSLFIATPVISPAGGSFTNSVTVTLSDATPNSTIYYTLDGTVPTTNSPIYTGPFVLTTSASVHAMASQPGAASSGVASTGFVDSSEMGTGAGLLGQYYANTTSKAFTNINFSGLPTLTRTDATINFNWGTAGPGSGVGKTNFAVLWSGVVQPNYSELYTLQTTADDGVRLYVNGQLLINDWGDKAAATTNSGSIALSAQQYYNIVLQYYQKTNNASVALAWSSPSTPLAIIPQTQLYPFTNPPPSVVLNSPAGSATNFTATASVTINASADAPNNPVDSVNFFANGAFLGSVSNAPYTLTATGLPAGNYTLTAVAVDGSGLSSASAPVNITVATGSGQPYGLTSNSVVPAFFNMPTTFNGTLPALLSKTGVYIDMVNRVTTSGLIPYVPNTPLWSDGAVKSRYLAVPTSGGVITPDQQISFQPTNSWSFPAGMVFVKNFDLVVNATNASVPLRRLETRLLVRDINGAVYGVTYKWRPDNSDADLLQTSLNEAILITNATGISTQTWYYPSPSDCLQCHTAPANYVLGVNARQLNGNETYAATGVTDNQLRTLNRLGLFNPAFDEAAITNFEKLSALTNLTASLQERSRSYLDANCAQCHLPGGTGITFDARYDTPLAKQKITNYPASFGLGTDHACVIRANDIWRSMIYQRMNATNSTYKMPSLARNLIDTNAVQVIADWINSLPGIPALAPPVLNPPGGVYSPNVVLTLTPPDSNAVIYYTLDGTVPTTSSMVYVGPITLTNGATFNANAFETGYNNSVAVGGNYTVISSFMLTSLMAVTNGTFQIQLNSLPGENYVLQASTDMVNWVSISTNVPVSTPFNLTDPAATNFSHRFYRVLLQF